MVARGVTAAIAIEGVAKTFAGRPVIAGVSASIGDHEFVSVLGPSGCGKSTLLRLIAGLEPIDGGEVRLFDARVTAPAADVGFVFQTSNLLPWLDVRGNLLLGVELDRSAARPSEAQLAELIETLGLSGFEESFPHQLSGGMRHRVAIGQALVLVTHSIAEAVLLSDRVIVMSERPSRVVEEVTIDLPRPRDPSRTREDPAFGDYVVRLSRLMGVE